MKHWYYVIDSFISIWKIKKKKKKSEIELIVINRSAAGMPRVPTW